MVTQPAIKESYNEKQRKVSKTQMPDIDDPSTEVLEQSNIWQKNDIETKNLTDYDNPTVKNKALILTKCHETIENKIAALFYYVRDDIKFQFPDEGDFVAASLTIKHGYGQCNNKTILYLALCKAIGIDARAHFSLIDKSIQRGLITGLLYWFMPQKISHCWLEVKLNNKWFPIDSYINDAEYYLAAKKKLIEKGWDTGYSVASSKNESSIELDFNKEQFVQMDAVTDDHGVYDDPVEYYKSSKYKNRPNALALFIYKIFIRSVNDRAKKMRYS